MLPIPPKMKYEEKKYHFFHLFVKFQEVANFRDIDKQTSKIIVIDIYS